MHINWLDFGSFLVIFHILGILAACHAVMYTRTSQGAVAWVIALISLPYVTLVPYFFLGASQFSSYQLQRKRAYKALRHNQQTLVTADQIPIQNNPLFEDSIKALSKMSKLSLLPGNHVQLLINGKATFSAIFSTIQQAKEYIIIQFYIIKDDKLGQTFQKHLIAAAKRGIKVYFLFDDIGSFDLPKHYLKTLTAHKIQVYGFSRKKFLLNRFQLNFRNHRKVVIIDGQQAFIGGHNVGNEYLGDNQPLSPWRDTHIAITGPVVNDIQLIFSEDWYWASRKILPLNWSNKTIEPANQHCLLVPMGPSDQTEQGSLFFTQIINLARQRIWLTSPYLIPDDAITNALKLAVLRGVEVKILIPSRRDHFVVYEASTLYAYELLSHGIQVYRYTPGFLHQKVVLIDDYACAIGTANLDNRSFRLNFELMLLTVDTKLAQEVETMLQADFKQAQAMQVKQYRHEPLFHRIIMHVARLFAPIL